MMSSRRPPTRMPMRPLFQPAITVFFAPRVKVKGWAVHEDWITWPVEYVASTYWTLRWSPVAANVPLPTIRSALSSWVGGVPTGTVTEGETPEMPGADRSASGMGRMPMRALPPGAVVTDPLLAWCVVVVEPAPVEVVGEELQAASPKAPAAPRATTSARTGRSMGRDGSRSLRPWSRSVLGEAAGAGQSGAGQSGAGQSGAGQGAAPRTAGAAPLT